MNKTLKSILSLVLCVCFVLALSACGKQNNDTTANNTDTNVSNNNVTDDNTDDSADITPEESTAGDSNILVAYFSWSGNTQQVANWISDKTGGELFRIIPEVEYTEDDVFDRAQDELNNGTRPPLSSHIDQEVTRSVPTWALHTMRTCCAFVVSSKTVVSWWVLLSSLIIMASLPPSPSNSVWSARASRLTAIISSRAILIT